MEHEVEVRISLPLAVQVSKKRKFILNLNDYRNAHYQTLAKAKQLYSYEVKQACEKVDADILKKYSEFRIHYIYYPETRRVYDIANVCSVIDKFTCDSLTELGIWPDDNINYLKSVSYYPGGIDRVKPRCDLLIRAYNEIK